MNEIRKPLNLPIITGRPDTAVQKPGKPAAQAQGASFGELLKKSIEQQSTQTQQLTFSKHAQARTEQRGISLTENDLDRLSEAVGKAGDKGLKDTLVFMNNTAFIINVPSKVVVTVVDNAESENTVFTNIDGAVII